MTEIADLAAWLRDEVRDLKARAEASERRYEEMCLAADTAIQRAEAAEAELRENECVIRVWRRRAVEADADARRYQWIRNADGDAAMHLFLSTEPDEMDAAIDAELAKEGK